jgi:nucleotide-binding universal stress UspA family protein
MKAIEFRRILCPINFADGSRRTVEGASILAAMYGAELRLFHVVSNGSSSREAEGLIGSLLALTRTLPARSRVSAALAYGDPSSEIIQHARLMRADLIVLGSERRSTPAEVRNAIVASVASHADCPVLHVRPHLLPLLSDETPGFTEIVCCVDATAEARTRDDYAHAFALRDSSRVTLLNVADVDDERSESAPETATHVNGRPNVVRVSLTGQPGPEIVALATQIRADLIVVSAQDESSPQRLGSTTAHVMVHAPCPVLIVPQSPRVFHLTSDNVGVDEAKGLQ